MQNPFLPNQLLACERLTKSTKLYRIDSVSEAHGAARIPKGFVRTGRNADGDAIAEATRSNPSRFRITHVDAESGIDSHWIGRLVNPHANFPLRWSESMNFNESAQRR